VENDPILQQHDGFNCGLIACLKVLELYGIIPMNSIDGIGKVNLGYQGIVMEYYSRLLQMYGGDLQYRLSKTYMRRARGSDLDVVEEAKMMPLMRMKTKLRQKLKASLLLFTLMSQSLANQPWTKRTGGKNPSNIKYENLVTLILHAVYSKLYGHFVVCYRI
jgi:hypothetical protein